MRQVQQQQQQQQQIMHLYQTGELMDSTLENLSQGLATLPVEESSAEDELDEVAYRVERLSFPNDVTVEAKKAESDPPPISLSTHRRPGSRTNLNQLNTNAVTSEIPTSTFHETEKETTTTAATTVAQLPEPSPTSRIYEGDSGEEEIDNAAATTLPSPSSTISMDSTSASTQTVRMHIEVSELIPLSPAQTPAHHHMMMNHIHSIQQIPLVDDANNNS